MGIPTYDFIQSVRSYLRILEAEELSNDDELIYELCRDLGVNHDQLIHKLKDSLIVQEAKKKS